VGLEEEVIDPETDDAEEGRRQHTTTDFETGFDGFISGVEVGLILVPMCDWLALIHCG